MELIDSIILPGSLWLIMFSMGLHLTLDDFRRVMTNRRALTLGMVSMLIVPPLIGIPIAIFFAPTPALLVGFILLATCPGGMLSNLMTDFAKGDLALSLSLSILVSMIYVFVVPFYAHFALVQFMDVDAQVELPMLNFFWKIFSITLIPASLGLLSNTLWPKLAAKIKTPVKLGGTLALVVAFGYILVDQIPVLVQYADSLFGISLAMNVLTLASAIALSKAMVPPSFTGVLCPFCPGSIHGCGRPGRIADAEFFLEDIQHYLNPGKSWPIVQYSMAETCGKDKNPCETWWHLGFGCGFRLYFGRSDSGSGAICRQSFWY